MRPFRCPVTILNTIDHLGKFDGKADEGFFVGYSINSKAFRVFNSRNRIVEENLHVYSPDARFKPSIDGEKKVDGDPSKEDEINDQEKDGNVNSTNNVNAVSSTVNVAVIEVNVVGTKTSIELPDDLNMQKLEDIVYSDDDEDLGTEADINNLDVFMPVSPIPTTRVDKDHPVEQIIGDLNSTPQTRRMTKFLEEHEPKKVIYALKDPSWIKAMQEELLQFKYTQEEGIDYDEVFAPVARIEAIRLFLAYASFKDFVVYQMDVKSAFLYGKIKKEVYVYQPPGFEDPDFPDRVYKVEKALYRLHQAPRACFTDVKTASTSMETQKPLLKDEDGEKVNVHLYRSIIGSLMYLTFSRPDIMFVVCACARYQVNPKISHLHAVKRIFRYLKGQPKLDLWYPKHSPFDLVAYTDGDYAGASLDMKSTIGGKDVWNGMEKLLRKELELVLFADTHNLVSFLTKSDESEGFEQIVDFLNTSSIRYALTVNPTIYTSCIQQFWATVKVKTINGEVQLQALVDGKKIVVTEAYVRRDLQLEDAKGIDYLPNATIFKQLTIMGYEKLSQKLIFYKAFFSPQWKFLIHTILQCLSAKTTAWNEFSSTMASAIICLSINQKFNFSKYIFESMVKNLDNEGKFMMYLRFVQVFLNKQMEGMSSYKRIYVTPSHTKKIFANMKRQGKGFSGRETPLFPTMVVQAQEEIGEGSKMPTDPHHTPIITQPSTSKPQKKQKPRKPKRKDTKAPLPSGPITNVADEAFTEENVSKHSNDPLLSVIDLETTKTTQGSEITSLKRRVNKLEKKNKLRTHKLKILYKVGLSRRVESSDEASLGDQEDASKQGRKIDDIDADVGITLVDET
ncbi:ribonuclease H-like domain-containing protein [Tanacetum coccineum]